MVRRHKRPSGTLLFQIKNVILHPVIRYGLGRFGCCGQPGKQSVREDGKAGDIPAVDKLFHTGTAIYWWVVSCARALYYIPIYWSRKVSIFSFKVCLGGDDNVHKQLLSPFWPRWPGRFLYICIRKFSVRYRNSHIFLHISVLILTFVRHFRYH